MIIPILILTALLGWLFLKLKFKKIARGFIALAGLLFFLAAGGLLSPLLLVLLPTESRLEKADWSQRNAIITLGKGSVLWSESHIRNPRREAFVRLHEAQRQYLDCKRHAPNCTLIMSGGNPSHLNLPSLAPQAIQSEAQDMKRALIEIGVPESDILTEDKSRNTEENALFTAALIHQYSFDHLVLVTSGHHMKRSVFWFERQGLTVQKAPADGYEPQSSFGLSADNLAEVDRILHEIVGYAYARLKSF